MARPPRRTQAFRDAAGDASVRLDYLVLTAPDLGPRARVRAGPAADRGVGVGSPPA